MATVTITCPHCGTAKSSYDIFMPEKDGCAPDHASAFFRCRTHDRYLLIDFYRRSGGQEIAKYSRGDAIHPHFFRESYLKYIYELPGLIADRRERAAHKSNDNE